MSDQDVGGQSASSGEAGSAAGNDPVLRLLSRRMAEKDKHSDVTVEDERVAAFFRIRPDMAQAFRVSPSEIKGIARRAKVNINVVNERERASFLESLGTPEEMKSVRERRWVKTRVITNLLEALKTAPDVALALGVVPGTDPGSAAVKNAEAIVGRLGENEKAKIYQASPDAEETPRIGEVTESSSSDRDDHLPDPFADPTPFGRNR